LDDWIARPIDLHRLDLKDPIQSLKDDVSYAASPLCGFQSFGVRASCCKQDSRHEIMLICADSAVQKHCPFISALHRPCSRFSINVTFAMICYSSAARQEGCVMILLLMAQAAVAQQPLNITCLGGGTANKVTVATVNSYGSFSGNFGTTPVYGSGSESSTVMGTRQQGFEDQVDVRLFSGDDRIRLPRTILPVVHGGSDGWFKLKNVQADAHSIHASAAINFMNNPKVYIDRVSGTISISGKAGDYSGHCQAVAASATPQF